MRSKLGFTDSDMVRYRHEADRGWVEQTLHGLKHDPIRARLCPSPNPPDTGLFDMARVWLERLLETLQHLSLCEQHRWRWPAASELSPCRFSTVDAASWSPLKGKRAKRSPCLRQRAF
jgi:hypothetical protein